MSLEFEPRELSGVVLCRPRLHHDNRGYFAEQYRRDTYAAGGIDRDFVQLNYSYSTRNVLRGMHYQLKQPQAKLVTVLNGRALDVVVDVRRSSPTFGKWMSVELSSEKGEQLFVPEGMAHGFLALSDSLLLSYFCSDYYKADDEVGFHWNSKAVGIAWPTSAPVVSAKDETLPQFQDIPRAQFAT